MQHIQWFPGHMTKAMRMMEENMKLCDGGIFVLDARATFACINRNLLKIFNNKPILFLINKSDLISQADLSKICEQFKQKNMPCLATIGTSQKDAKAVYSAINELLREKTERRMEKGISKSPRIMVCGIPNTGKSTIINALCGRKTAQTGDKAGVTKGKQWVKFDGLELLDTPGTMPPSFENQKLAHHLAYIGCLNDEILDLETLCLDFIEELGATYPELVKEKYGATGQTPLEVFDSLCVKRGFVIKGGEPDYLRGARSVLDDFRKGKLGKICLEKEWQ